MRVDETGAVAKGQDAARAALDEARWGEVRRILTERAEAGALTVDELDWLGTAEYLTGDDEPAFAHWTAAHVSALDAGDTVRAARIGNQLASALAFKGDIGRFSGWLDRVRRVLDDAGVDCVETGYVEHESAFLRLITEGDVPGARAGFARAGKVADRFHDRELRTLALLGEGRCLIYLGELAEGLALLDQAMVAVEAGEIATVTAGDAYCTVIDGCHELFDYKRCEAWSASFAAWCDARPELVLYRGHCLIHRAEVLQLHGRWEEAVECAQDACRRLADPPNPMALGGASYVEAELHRLRDNTAEAERAYERANEIGCEPQPGLSLLRLAQGRVDVADAAIKRVLAQADNPIARARVLGPYNEIVLAAGDLDAARVGAEELAAVATQLASPYLRARAEHAKGAVLLAAGSAAEALAPLRRAWKAWVELDAPYEIAQTRVLLARACEAVGDHDGAGLERAAARSGFEQVGAKGELRRLDPAPAEGAPDGLTDREVEVLVLVAKGHTNRAIAQELFISEKTVASHLSHVFTKLGLASRSAATAYAYERGLV
jgi:DNA-binding CsgD family transcriptional regulator/tetratricopeptide (TPR) repeat protein